ncbi:hypothetical protein SERLA73DRAFT_177060 [Serpula lacrymans var. lacrymans S7.3]|uniref:Uncharacterized protein n=1 Tax=Serpula lacrymans var. lacrymans (strain S7.3) TaxID=936435 RepID=F8PQY5_SERL3|nr:hypothetical protein SERLA73DRAFT_177060 [Serpula lacrymans var. lacrymans S7.3]
MALLEADLQVMVLILLHTGRHLTRTRTHVVIMEGIIVIEEGEGEEDMAPETEVEMEDMEDTVDMGNRTVAVMEAVTMEELITVLLEAEDEVDGNT